MGFEVNLKNVSQAVQEAVAGFMAGNGDDDTKIDSKEEYQNLSNYLAGEGNMLNRDEVSFVKEKLEKQIIHSLTDINVIALLMAAIRTEEDFQKGS